MEADSRTQEELFHMLDALLRSGIQLVIAADRSPRALSTLDTRLRSRFEGGLVVEIASSRPASEPRETGDEAAVEAAAGNAEDVAVEAAVPETSATEVAAPAAVPEQRPDRIPSAPAPSSQPAGGVPATSDTKVDSWYFNGEKIAWSWLALNDRVIEEVG
jgi:hypothetical protein